MISINGVCFTEEEISEIISENIRSRNNKMNKKEAVKKLVEVGITNPLSMVKGLEALGLIKFEDEKEDDTNYVELAKRLVDSSIFNSEWGSWSHVMKGLLKIIEMDRIKINGLMEFGKPLFYGQYYNWVEFKNIKDGVAFKLHDVIYLSSSKGEMKKPPAG
jgi:hypothetical protein